MEEKLDNLINLLESNCLDEKIFSYCNKRNRSIDSCRKRLQDLVEEKEKRKKESLACSYCSLNAPSNSRKARLKRTYQLLNGKLFKDD